MKVIAVSARYPTAMQTWFINFLEAIEPKVKKTFILSLEHGEGNYNPKVDRITSQAVLTYRRKFFFDLIKSLTFVVVSGQLPSIFRIIQTLRKDGFTYREIVQGLRGLHLFPRLDADIIHCHSEKAAFATLPLLLLIDKPLILTFHGMPPQGVTDLQYRQRRILLKYVSLLLVNTQFAADQYSCLAPHNLPVMTIKQGINLSDFPFFPTPYPKRSADIHILTVGRIDRLKGHKLVIDAIIHLSKLRLKLNYTIVGAGYYAPTLANYIADKGIGEQVSIKPPAMGESLLKYFFSHDIFILPSFTEEGQWAETQGIVIQEAQACGLPVIASDSGGISECIHDGEDALLFTQASKESLSKQLKRLLDSEELWNRLVHAGRKNVEKSYSLNSMGNRLIETYENVLNTDRSDGT